METIAVLVARIFASAVADGLVLIAPHRQTSVDAVLVGVDHRAFDDDSRNDRLDRFLLHIGQHPKNDLAITLDQTQDRRLFLFQRTTVPLSRRRRPARPFFGRVALVSGDDIDLVGLDRAFQRRLGDFGNQTSAKMRRHVVIAVQAQLLSDLLVRQVEPHEIQTQDPGPKRLMVSSQNSTGQVIEPRSAILTPVPLPMSLGFIMADHGGAGTARAANAVRPAIVPDQLIALSIKDVRVIICSEVMVSTG